MKSVVVTGASSGIGKEIAKYFFSKDWQVFALARRGEKLIELRDSLGDRLIPVLCDLTQPESITYAIKDIVNKADTCLLYTSPSPRDATLSRMPSSA